MRSTITRVVYRITVECSQCKYWHDITSTESTNYLTPRMELETIEANEEIEHFLQTECLGRMYTSNIKEAGCIREW